MPKKLKSKSVPSVIVAAVAFATAAYGTTFNVPAGSLDAALDAYTAQSGIPLIGVTDQLREAQSKGVTGDLPADVALTRILKGTGFVPSRDRSGAINIVRSRQQSSERDTPQIQLAEAPAAPSSLETVTVTSSKIGGDVQNIPISITAMSQEQLTATQTAGGPDLVKEVPNLTFSKTNFTGYNIQIRGIGTQAISVTTDPAVAVAFNDIPFIRNHFFEQEFYDLSQAEVLRGPQGTLYGRNATAGVVNIVSARPADQFEAMVSADFGNYQNRRFEGMVNVPIVDDRLDIRLAGEWTKRNGYSFNETTNAPIDGRDLWSGRASIAFKPTGNFKAALIWEHFSEDDDRLRSGKQLCKTAPVPTEIGGMPIPPDSSDIAAAYLNQGCVPTSLYSPDAFEVPQGRSLPYVAILAFGGVGSPSPYTDVVQSTNLRHIESTLTPVYKAKNDILEFTTDYQFTPSLMFSTETGFNHDSLYSAEDYNRFNTRPDIFNAASSLAEGDHTVIPDGNWVCSDGTISIGSPDQCPAGSVASAPTGVFCDPQLGCSSKLVGEDLSEERAWQLSQEFRLASNFTGPLNFSVGANYLHYETEENYYVFLNSITLQSIHAGPDDPYIPGVFDNHACFRADQFNGGRGGFQNPYVGISNSLVGCGYIDPNPISSLDNEGHNYFLSQNPYTLNSYAGFGEAYYQVVSDLKLTGGVRWTDDRKHFVLIPSWLAAAGYGYPVFGAVDQGWDEWTGRAAANWTPKLSFTDQTLVYASFAHGYKAGGANPPGAVLAGDEEPTHPLTFKPEFINAFELGSKNTLLDGALTLNADAFYYDYKGYQISEIVDRTSINLNFDAKVHGAELEAMWEPAPGLKFNFAGGYEATRINNGQQAVDLMDRTAGNPLWVLVKPFITNSSNCILPAYVVAAAIPLPNGLQAFLPSACGYAYDQGFDPWTGTTYVLNPTKSGKNVPIGPPPGYVGFDPLAGTPGDPYTGQNTSGGIDYGPAPNNGAGFDKNVGGHELPGAPHFTASISAEYTLPLSTDWVSTAHTDFYYQADSWARVFNDNPYDRVHGYTNLNLALIFTNQNGWQVLGYLKNVFNTTAITGDFLNSDDSGLTTNVFLTDPRLFGVRVTKNF